VQIDDGMQTLHAVVCFGIQIQAEYGVFGPLVFQPLQGQAVEEFFLFRCRLSHLFHQPLNMA
jgi:hypothetical protein